MKSHRLLTALALVACCAIAITFAFGVSPDAVVALVGAVHGHGFDANHMMIASAGAVAVSPEEVKKAVEGLMTTFEQFKDTNDTRLKEIEKKGGADPVTVDKLNKIETSLAGFEGLNQRLTQAEAKNKALEEHKEQSDALLAKMEAKLGRPGAQNGTERRIELKKRVNDWGHAVYDAYAMGSANLSAEQQKALSDVVAEYKALNVGTDTAGGYLAPTEYVAEIIKGVTEISPARSIVKVRQSANKAIQLPKRTGQFAARRVSEQGTKTETTGLTYGLEEMPLPEMYALIDISNQMLEDSAFDMEAEIREEAQEQFAVKEGAEFVSGSGVGEMEGILTNASVASTVSGSAAVIADSDGQANGLMTLFHAIKTDYTRNANWILNRTTLGSVRKLKDSQKQYIWMPGLANGVPNTILGAPYVEMPDMPSEGANLYPIGFGDFRRAYTMADRISMEMLRDPFTQATSGNIRFILRKRLGGKVVLAEAIRLLKCST
ncbi:phage major capsid protein [Mesorhizobium sp. M0768]|uniref:phage major capsid protein n=1 Tax=Mesorhizobium sp. M0768 TaxID=2956996 RepID=UPI0033374A85